MRHLLPLHFLLIHALCGGDRLLVSCVRASQLRRVVLLRNLLLLLRRFLFPLCLRTPLVGRSVVRTPLAAYPDAYLCANSLCDRHITLAESRASDFSIV